MKKLVLLATAALLISGVTFANTDKGKGSKKCSKSCCKKSGKKCGKKEAAVAKL